MRTIELFAGTRSFSSAALRLGHETFTTDYREIDGQTLVADICTLSSSHFPYSPDILWASPPCEGFSVASIGANWGGGPNGYEPKSDSARNSIMLAKQAIRIVEELKPKLWFIENPRGMLRKMPFMEELLKKTGGVRKTVWYCQYGDTRAKPTDIWTNAIWWKPRPVCKNNSPTCHHQRAPRGSRNGTQGIRTYKDRSRIPEGLFIEIFEQLDKHCAQPPLLSDTDGS